MVKNSTTNTRPLIDSSRPESTGSRSRKTRTVSTVQHTAGTMSSAPVVAWVKARGSASFTSRQLTCGHLARSSVSLVPVGRCSSCSRVQSTGGIGHRGSVVAYVSSMSRSRSRSARMSTASESRIPCPVSPVNRTSTVPMGESVIHLQCSFLVPADSPAAHCGRFSGVCAVLRRLSSRFFGVKLHNTRCTLSRSRYDRCEKRTPTTTMRASMSNARRTANGTMDPLVRAIAITW